MEELKNFLSNKILLLMIMVCLVFTIQVFNLFGNENETQKVNYIKKEIIGLKKDVDKIHKHYDSLELKIDTFKRQINTIHKSVDANNSKIETLKQYEKDKKNSFKSYTARMWEQYFTDRYSKKINTPAESGK